MNALEKLGYVKQPQEEDDWGEEYRRKNEDSPPCEPTEVIYIKWRECMAKKYITYWHGKLNPSIIFDYLSQAELKAILELMEEER